MKTIKELEDDLRESGAEFIDIESVVSVCPDLVALREYRRYKINSVIRQLKAVFEEIAEDNGQTIDGVTLEVQDAAQDLMANYARIRRYAEQAEAQYKRDELDKKEADLLASNAMAAEFKAAAGDRLRHYVSYVRSAEPFKSLSGYANVCSAEYSRSRGQESCLHEAIKFKQIIRTREAGLKGFEFKKGEKLDGTEWIGVDKAAELMSELEEEGAE
jgi:hypothetical protein